MPARIEPATAPYPDYARETLAQMTRPGRDTLILFKTLATDERLMKRFFGGGLLDRGHLTIREREIVIDRITALCGSEYEWGVHFFAFGEKAGLTREELTSLVIGGPDDSCWSDAERTLIHICDRVDAKARLDDSDWDGARAFYEPHAIFEILMLCGYYRMVSYITNGLDLPLENWAPRFADYGRAVPTQEKNA